MRASASGEAKASPDWTGELSGVVGVYGVGVYDVGEPSGDAGVYDVGEYGGGVYGGVGYLWSVENIGEAPNSVYGETLCGGGGGTGGGDGVRQRTPVMTEVASVAAGWIHRDCRDGVCVGESVLLREGDVVPASDSAAESFGVVSVWKAVPSAVLEETVPAEPPFSHSAKTGLSDDDAAGAPPASPPSSASDSSSARSLPNVFMKPSF